MKKILSFLLSITFAASFFTSTCASSQSEERVKRENPKSMLILGDSIASGYGLEGYKKNDCYSAENYGAMLASEYGLVKNDSYNNFGIDGQTSAELAQKLENGSYDDYLSSELVVISIGGNDLLGVLIGEGSVLFEQTRLGEFLNGEISFSEALESVNISQLSSQINQQSSAQIAQFRTNMPRIINYIREKNPDVQIVLQTLYNPMNGSNDFIKSLYQSVIDQLNIAINETENCVIADVFSAFEQSEENLIQDDYTHPNAEGHKVIFQTVSQTVSQECEFYDMVSVQTNTQSKEVSGKFVKMYAFFAGGILVLFAAVGAFMIIKAKKFK